jgi:hypothetical protein
MPFRLRKSSSPPPHLPQHPTTLARSASATRNRFARHPSCNSETSFPQQPAGAVAERAKLARHSSDGIQTFGNLSNAGGGERALGLPYSLADE